MAPPAKAGPTEPGPLAYEGEGLAVGAKATEGAVVVQPMAQFGPAWSHNAQLLWMPTKVGAALSWPLLVGITHDANYAFTVGFTKGPDYGEVQLAVNGAPVGQPFDGYAPQVTHAELVTLGTAVLRKGPAWNQIQFTVAGKNPNAKGYYVGIDQIRMTPVASAQSGFTGPALVRVPEGLPKAVTVKWSGGARHSEPKKDPPPPPPPPALSWAAKLSAVPAASGLLNMYAYLSVSQPWVKDRGYLRFWHPFGASAHNPPGDVTFDKAGGSVDIGLQLPGGQRYLVDCAVAALTKVTYRVALPAEAGGGVQLFPCVIPPNLGQHLLVVFDLQALDPKTSYPCGANLSVQEPNGQWIFFSCEVTKL